MKIMINGEAVEANCGVTMDQVNSAIADAAANIRMEEAYSAGETRIGTWTDGKPLYRRTFQAVPAGSPGVWIPAAGPVQDIETVCSLSGVFYHSAMNASYAVPFFAGSSFGISIGYSYTAGIVVFVTVNDYLNQRYLINIEYTKTTDQAAVERPAAFQTESAPSPAFRLDGGLTAVPVTAAAAAAEIERSDANA